MILFCQSNEKQEMIQSFDKQNVISFLFDSIKIEITIYFNFFEKFVVHRILQFSERTIIQTFDLTEKNCLAQKVWFCHENVYFLKKFLFSIEFVFSWKRN